MSHRKWRETKHNPSRTSSGHLISCCLFSLHFRYDILAPIPVLPKQTLAPFSNNRNKTLKQRGWTHILTVCAAFIHLLPINVKCSFFSWCKKQFAMSGMAFSAIRCFVPPSIHPWFYTRCLEMSCCHAPPYNDIYTCPFSDRLVIACVKACSAKKRFLPVTRVPSVHFTELSYPGIPWLTHSLG